MTELQESTAARRPAPSREQIHLRLMRLKKGVVAGALIGFASILGLVAHHSVGVTSSGQAAVRSSPQAPAPSSGGFFANGNSGSGVGSSGGSSPVLGSGGS